MPGIVGIVTSLPRQQAERELLQMVAAMRHHASYVCGTWIDETQGIYLGWVAREGSLGASMPVQNERGNATLVFSGEDFPDPSVSHRLRNRGHELDNSTASYLVHLY